MFNKLMKKKRVLAGLTVAMLAVTGAAFAYFTSTGTGTGSATVGSSSNWTVGETTHSGGPLFPDASIGGANIQTDAYKVVNAGSGSQYLTQVEISVAEANGSAWSSQKDLTKPACNKSDFSVGEQDVGSTWTDIALAGDFTAGQEKATGSVKVELIDNHENQDNCQGVTVPLYFHAS